MEVTAGLWGGCSAPQVHQASPDYITAFILTNGISWWGIPRVVGIKIPGHVGHSKYVAHAQTAAALTSTSSTVDTQNWKGIYTFTPRF